DDTGAWTPYAIELNLRKGGTTHPFLTLQFLTDGTYDGERGGFLTPSGSSKYLVATDHFEDDRLKALTVGELFDAVVRNGLHFDQARRTGVVFHMISCLTECGRVGLTAVGDTPEDAWRIYEQAQSVVLHEAEQALVEGSIIGESRSAANVAAWLTMPFTEYRACATLGAPGAAPLQMVSPSAHWSMVLGTYSGPMTTGGAPTSRMNWSDGLPNRVTAAT